MFIFLALFTTVLSLSCRSAWAKDFEFIAQEVDPYYYKDAVAGVQGAYYDIMKTICDKEKLSCKFKLSSFRNSLEMIKRGEADAGGPFMRSRQRETALRYSEAVSKARFTFYGLPETAKKIQSFKDLDGYTVGTLSPSLVAISLQKINEFIGNTMIIGEEASLPNALRKTEARVYQLSYAEVDMAKLWIEKTHSPLIEIPDLGEGYDLHIVFSKKTVDTDLYKRINGALEKMKKSGQLKKILQKYKVEASDGN